MPLSARASLLKNSRLERALLSGSRTRNSIALITLFASLIVASYYIWLGHQRSSTTQPVASVAPLSVPQPSVIVDESPAFTAPAVTDDQPAKEIKVASTVQLRVSQLGVPHPRVTPNQSLVIAKPPVADNGPAEEIKVASAVPQQDNGAPKGIPSLIPVPAESISPKQPFVIRNLFIEPIGNHLDEYLRAEFSKQLGKRIVIVTHEEQADAILCGLSAKETAQNDPSDDTETASLSLYDKARKTILWSGTATNRGNRFSGEHGGQSKVAQKLVNDLKKRFVDGT